MNQCFLHVQDIKLWWQMIIIQILTTVRNAKTASVYNNQHRASITLTIETQMSVTAQIQDVTSKTYILTLKVIFSDTVFAIMDDSFLSKPSSSPHFEGGNALFSPLQLMAWRFDSSRGQGFHTLSKWTSKQTGVNEFHSFNCFKFCATAYFPQTWKKHWVCVTNSWV